MIFKWIIVVTTICQILQVLANAKEWGGLIDLGEKKLWILFEITYARDYFCLGCFQRNSKLINSQIWLK